MSPTKTLYKVKERKILSFLHTFIYFYSSVSFSKTELHAGTVDGAQ